MILNQIQNGGEGLFKLSVILLFAEPFTVSWFVTLVVGAFVLTVARIFYEVFLTRALTSFFRNIKRRLGFLPKETEAMKRKQQIRNNEKNS